MKKKTPIPKRKYEPGKQGIAHIPPPPENTSGKQGYFTDNDPDGFFIHWVGESVSIVVKKDGIEYSQTMDQFIENSIKPSSTDNNNTGS